MVDVGSREEEFCRDEYLDHVVYHRLSLRERDGRLRDLLGELAEQERRHYEFWRRVAGGCSGGSVGWRASLLLLARRVLGLTFVVKLLERREERVVEEYRGYLGVLSGGEREELERIIEEEVEHEKRLVESIDEGAVRYLGFVALGLADAIIEITGVHAGFLGATAATLVAGLAGLIVGFSAAMSMAAAAYVQAKHSRGPKPLPSALVTGLAYFLTVVLLAVPYFLTHSSTVAFASSVAIAVLLQLFFTMYSSVVNDRGFLREAGETVGVLFLTALAAYLFGDFVGGALGLKGLLG